MGRYRIGYDMTILWAINGRNGAAFPLDDKEVHLYYTCERGRFEADVQIQDGHVVVWDFPAIEQRYLGGYSLTMEILQSDGKRAIRKDICDAFELVGKGCEEFYDDGEAILNGGEITLASELDIYRISPIIPYVGDNFNWWVDGVDTGKTALGVSVFNFGDNGSIKSLVGGNKLRNQSDEKDASLAFAVGYQNTASGDKSVALGNETTASGQSALSAGNRTKATGNNAFACGTLCEATANNSHAEGMETIASNLRAHAEGYKTQAKGENSHAEGYNTLANNTAEHACGKFNVSTTGGTEAENTLFSVGCGKNQKNRENAFEIKENGEIYIKFAGGFMSLQSMLSALLGYGSSLSEASMTSLVDEYINAEEGNDTEGDSLVLSE